MPCVRRGASCRPAPDAARTPQCCKRILHCGNEHLVATNTSTVTAIRICVRTALSPLPRRVFSFRVIHLQSSSTGHHVRYNNAIGGIGNSTSKAMNASRFYPRCRTIQSDEVRRVDTYLVLQGPLHRIVWSPRRPVVLPNKEPILSGLFQSCALASIVCRCGPAASVRRSPSQPNSTGWKPAAIGCDAPRGAHGAAGPRP